MANPIENYGLRSANDLNQERARLDQSILDCLKETIAEIINNAHAGEKREVQVYEIMIRYTRFINDISRWLKDAGYQISYSENGQDGYFNISW